jgi:hypothetical protein
MRGKKIDTWVPLFLAIGAVFLVVYNIVRRDNNSWLAQGVGWISEKVEGFDSPAKAAKKCPQGMQPFNTEKGANFCCGATVNPYGATCSDPARTCALEPTEGVTLCKP